MNIFYSLNIYMMRPQRWLNEEAAIEDACVLPAVLVVEEEWTHCCG